MTLQAFDSQIPWRLADIGMSSSNQFAGLKLNSDRTQEIRSGVRATDTPKNNEFCLNTTADDIFKLFCTDQASCSFLDQTTIEQNP